MSAGVGCVDGADDADCVRDLAGESVEDCQCFRRVDRVVGHADGMLEQGLMDRGDSIEQQSRPTFTKWDPRVCVDPACRPDRAEVDVDGDLVEAAHLVGEELEGVRLAGAAPPEQDLVVGGREQREQRSDIDERVHERRLIALFGPFRELEEGQVERGRHLDRSIPRPASPHKVSGPCCHIVGADGARPDGCGDARGVRPDAEAAWPTASIRSLSTISSRLRLTVPQMVACRAR